MSVQDDLDAIEAVRNAGLKAVTVDGNRTEWDLAELRRREAELLRKQQPGRRPRCAAFNLSGE